MRSSVTMSTMAMAACVMMIACASIVSSSSVSADAYDTSFLEMKNGVRAWSCCRICPQNHLLDIDQLFGSTPPPVRRYDDPQPAPSTFLELAERFRMKDSNCCNICPTGQSAEHASNAAPAPRPAGAKGVRRVGISAPLANLKFSLSRVPMPPCCPFCREEHQDEAYNSIIKPEPTRGLPYLQRRDSYSGKPILLETEVDMESESESESSESAQPNLRQGADQEYSYESATADYCCNRCMRAPTPTEEQIAGGANLWPQNEKKPEDYDAQAAKENEPGAMQKRLANNDRQDGEDEDDTLRF